MAGLSHPIGDWRRLGLVRPQPLDFLLAVAVAAAVAFTIAISQPDDPGMRSPNAFAYTLAALYGALVLFRRRWPVGVLMASFLLLQVYYWSNFPSIWPAVPLAVALYTAAAAGHLRWAVGVVIWYWVVPLVFALVGLLGPLQQTLNDLVRDGSLMIAVVLFGDASRSHQALMADAEAQLRRVEEERAREARELSAARVIQQQLLPKELPALPGWRVAAYYQPARAIGGDFYDFLTLPDGQVALVTGDVTDKGIPAALVMATTHSILRGGGEGSISPGEMLRRANDRLYPDIPPHMFVTCLYAVLNPATGRLRFANAGHNLPYLATAGGLSQLRATGMPLGALPDMTYEENEVCLAPGDGILFHSDGLVEAHNPDGEMFGFPRLERIVASSAGGGERLIDECLMALTAFVGPGWEQEDDITLVTLGRQRGIAHLPAAAGEDGGTSVWRTLAEFSIPSERGNERRAMAEVAAVVSAHGLTGSGLERLKTAVAEATMNAMEHGNQYRPEVPVRIEVAASGDRLAVRVTDVGTGPERPHPETPDLAAKLTSQQSPRGWGLFLIERMVDEMRTERGEDHYTVELIFRLDDRPEGTGEWTTPSST